MATGTPGQTSPSAGRANSWAVTLAASADVSHSPNANTPGAHPCHAHPHGDAHQAAKRDTPHPGDTSRPPGRPPLRYPRAKADQGELSRSAHNWRGWSLGSSDVGGA